MEIRNICALMLILIANVDLGTPFRILFLPLHIRSHLYCMEAVATALEQRGHESHFVMNENYKVPVTLENKTGVRILRYRAAPGFDLNFDSVCLAFAKAATEGEGMKSMSKFKNASTLFKIESANLLLNNEDFITRLERNKYDVAFVDSIYFSKYNHLIAHRLGIPVVSMVHMVEPFVARVPWIPSFVPFFNVKSTEKMSFLERVINMVAYVVWEMFSAIPFEGEEVKRKYTAYGHYRDLHDLESRTKLWLLVAHDPVMGYPRPMMENMVNVGGLTTKPSQPLPKELAQFMDGAHNGAIVVSFGSMAEDLPKEVIEKFVAAFSKLSQRVIWRLKNLAGAKIPPNVKLEKWIPQNDLMGHPNTKLFISHGGTYGQFEALYHAVPMIAFPLFGDQSANAMCIQYKGFGIQMSFQSFTPEEFLANIRKLLNGGYRERVQKASRIYRSRPDTPGERAAHWIEHVAEHGVDYLHSYAMDMPLYQYLMLDVVGFLVGILTIFVWISFSILKPLFKKCFTQKSKRSKSD